MPAAVTCNVRAVMLAVVAAVVLPSS